MTVVVWLLRFDSRWPTTEEVDPVRDSTVELDVRCRCNARGREMLELVACTSATSEELDTWPNSGRSRSRSTSAGFVALANAPAETVPSFAPEPCSPATPPTNVRADVALVCVESPFTPAAAL